MKYHDCEIIKRHEDLGEDNPHLNFVYEIYHKGEWKNEALTLSTAKQYIDSGFDETYL